MPLWASPVCRCRRARATSERCGRSHLNNWACRAAVRVKRHPVWIQVRTYLKRYTQITPIAEPRVVIVPTETKARPSWGMSRVVNSLAVNNGTQYWALFNIVITRSVSRLGYAHDIT
jgi:hypothetical protein